MTPLGNRARIEELARLLEGSLAGTSSSTAPYAALAVRLRAVAPALDQVAAPRPEFRTALRQRLVAVASVQGVQAAPARPATSGALERAVAWSRTWTAQKRLAAVSGTLAGVVAITGVGVASSRSLPGQPFYALKRASEGLQLDLAGNDTDKGSKHLEFAATRLREVRALARGEGELSLGEVHGSGALASGLAGSALDRRITDTLGDFDSETTQGRTLLEGVFRRTGKTAPLRVLATFSAQQKSRLTSLIPELPTESATAAQRSLALVVDVGSTAGQLLDMGTCAASCDPDAAGPTLPVEPGPTPGTSATPSTEDHNGVPPCTCPEPSLTPEPTSAPTASPSPEPTPSSTPTRTPTPTPSPTGPVVLPTDLPTVLPTDLPTILPSLPPLPLPTDLPSLLPAPLADVVTKP